MSETLCSWGQVVNPLDYALVAAVVDVWNVVAQVHLLNICL